MPLNTESKGRKNGQEGKVSEIMSKWASEIISELKKEKTKISAGSISSKSKKSEKEIIRKLKAAGLPNKEIQSQVSQIRNIVIIELKKERKREKLRRERDMKLKGMGLLGKPATEKREYAQEKENPEESKKRFAFNQQLIPKIEYAMHEIYGKSFNLSSKLELLTDERKQLITAEYQGKKYGVILKEYEPETFCEPAVNEVIKCIDAGNYEIRTFSIEEKDSETRNYAVIEKVHGLTMGALMLKPVKIRGQESQYFRELGKIAALAYICAIPDRSMENIIVDKVEGNIKLTTYDFETAFDYARNPGIECAQNIIDLNTLFFGKIALYHVDSLKEGFVEALNSAKTKKFKITSITKEYAKVTKNASAVSGIKKIIYQDADTIFKRLRSKNSILKGDYAFVREITSAAVNAIEGKDFRGKYIRKFRPLDSRGKPGGLVQLPMKGKAYIIADLQGDLNNFLKIFEDNPRLIQELARGISYLIITGDLIHGNFVEDESTTQLDLLETVMLLKSKFPDNVHYLLGNHCLGEILGDEVMPIYKKGKISEQKYFEKLVKEKYGDEYKTIREGYVKFLKNLALMVRTKNGIIISHTGPLHGWDVKDMELSIDKFINIFIDGYCKENKELYQMLWSRFGERFIVAGKGYDHEDIEKFLSSMNAKVMVVGHTPCDGYMIHDKQMIVDSCGKIAGYLIVDLTDKNMNIEKLKEGFRRFKDGKSKKILYALNYEIMKN